MAFDRTPWFVGGGAEHSAELARVLAYTATGGAEGIVEPTGLKVLPLDVPGGGVRITPGAAYMLNRYPAGGEQTYIARHPSTTTLSVSPAPSGAQRTDLLVARIRDPQYAGSAPTDPTDHDYVEFQIIGGVPQNATAAYAASLGYPAIALAKWTLPPSTGTITAGMITDLRVLARPRVFHQVEMGAPTPNDHLFNETGAQWPSYAPYISIPAWATHMSVIATIASVGYQNGSVAGTLAVAVGLGSDQWRSSNTQYDLDVAPGDGARTTLVIGGKGAIPSTLRGTVQPFMTQGKRDAFTGAGGLVTRPGTHVVYQVTFSENIL